LGSGSLIKAGTGTQTIGSGTSGGAIYTGVTTVNNGTLRLGGVSSLTSAGNLTISGTAGPANLILADAAAVSVGGMVQVLYDGGAGTPSVCSLLVTNNAILTAGSLSYGNGSRLANLTSVTVQGNGVLSITNAFDLNGNIGSTAQTTLANVNGGTLAVGNFLDSAAGATHQAQINFNGGVLQANASDPISGPTTTFLPAFTGLTVYVNAGAGALINPNGYNITIAAPITHGNGTPDGGLTVIGAGTLTLNGANTYTGNTTVTNGTLALGGSGSIATSPRIIVGGGATFDVSALGGFVLGSSQTLSNSSSTATLNGNINTANGKVALTYAAGTPSFSVTNGTLTVPATTTFKVNNTGTALAIGSYKLISTNLNGSGLVTASTLPAVTVGGNGVAGGAGTPALQVNNSELYLVVPSGVNTNPTNLTATVTGSTLSLTWPPDHLGWTLQTNAADLANTNDWFPYPGSASVTNVNITIDPTQTNVFFRMVYP
jgi:autotransporter-associated beta strand protein